MLANFQHPPGAEAAPSSHHLVCHWPRWYVTSNLEYSARRQQTGTLAVVVRCATMYYMSHPLSVRLNDATIARLGRHAQRAHLAPRTLAQRYVEEGLRMDEHPLIRFADGPAGRRARLA